MSTYLYECSACGVQTEVVKPISQYDSEETCPTCRNLMEKIISATKINTSNCQFEAQFNPAFGKVISSKRQLEEEVRKEKYEKGRNLVEVGTDKLESVKKPRRHREYTY